MHRRCLVWYLVLTMLLIAIAPRVDAGLSPSDSVASVPSGRAQDLTKIQAVLERKIVEARLQDFGFTAGEIRNRLSDLTDQQIHHLSTRLEDVKIGGNGEGVLIGVLIIILVIAVILPLLGIRVWR